MPIDPITSLGSLTRLRPLADAPPASAAPAAGFAAVLNGLLGENTRANATADAAVAGLADGSAQDLHTVTLAVAQADLSFRLILELRNRLAEAFQEVTRMQV
ncbi:MAG: flagellar hook-basal body complex protein FliE [Gemmataceae bacterium]|nr:flagellar hook-basal body complex protein FliE [Gemmataceae bacterium]